jgi:GTPase SAR1 family protein
MPSSFKLKVVAVGQRSVKNIFFNNCNQVSNFFSESALMTVGVDIKLGYYSNEDDLTLSIWDISDGERFRFCFNTFFQGARAYLIFHEISNDNSKWKIEAWINMIRTSRADVPIFLIVNNPDLEMKIGFEDILRFVEEHQIEGFFLLSVRNRNRSSIIFDRISQKILESIGSESAIKKFRNTLSPKEESVYQKFLSYFSRCPICGNKNHQSNLNQIFFPLNSYRKNFKESLLNLMRQSENNEKAYTNKIKVGIPCCSCHKKVFS